MSESPANKAILRSDAVASRIARMIEGGELLPGAQLPPERELADTFEVSRAAVREAFMALTTVGLVEAHVGRGRFVTEDAPERRSHFLAGQLFELHKSDIADLSTVRVLLEVAAVGEISITSMPDAGAKMRPLLDDARRAMEARDFSLLAQLDSEFHSVPIEYCPNRPLRVLTAGVVLAMGEIIRDVLSDPDWDKISLDQHESIVSAFEAREPELATILIGRHQSAATRRIAETRADELEQISVD